MIINNLKRCFRWLLLLSISISLNAQDTIHINLEESEKLFVKSNLSLLAEKCNISIAQASVIQSRLFSNPTLSLSGNIYNPELKKLVDISNNTGEYTIALQQLVRLAGKRNKEIRLAEIGTNISENKFYDLLRTLQFSLRSTFFNIHYLQHSLNAYIIQINSLEKMSRSYDDLQSKAIVSLRDAVRIRALLYSLRAEKVTLQNQLNDLEADLQLLLQNNNAYFIAEYDNNKPVSVILKLLNLRDLIDTAMVNRYDLKLATANLLYNQANYRLQKAMATPDLTLGAAFDKRGSFVENAAFFTLAMDIPFFHRNQGNIHSARISIDQSNVLLQQQKTIVENEVQKAYLKAINIDKMVESMDAGFSVQYENLLKGITDNFQKGNVSLIEFVDFYESYKNNILQFNQLQNQRMQSLENLQFVVGKSFFN